MSDLSIPDLVIAVQADLATRGYPGVRVLYGDWNASKHSGANTVIIGLGSFEFLDPLGPGPYQQEDGTYARALYSRVQSCPVWVYAAPPVPATDPMRAEKSQVATAALLHATVRALWHVATGSLTMSPGEWPRPEDQQFCYGALATFQIKLWIPVLDDAHVAAQANAAASTKTTYTVVNGIRYQVARSP